MTVTLTVTGTLRAAALDKFSRHSEVLVDAENNRTPGTVSFSESIVIKASPEDAFAYLGDPATAERIDPAIISYVPDTVPMAVGTKPTPRKLTQNEIKALVVQLRGDGPRFRIAGAG